MSAFGPGSLRFEPHGAFRSGIDGEDWPLGYISDAASIGRPIFALHEVFEDQDASELAFLAELFAAAPDLLAAASRLLAVFDQQKMTQAERIIVGVSDAGLRTEGNAAIEALRVAIAKAGAA